MYYIHASCTRRFIDFPKILFSPILIETKSFPSNAPIDAHSVYIQSRKIMAFEAFDIDTIYHAGRVDMFPTFGAKPMDDCIGKFVDDYESVFCMAAAKRHARTIYTETLRQARKHTVQKTYSAEKK